MARVTVSGGDQWDAAAEGFADRVARTGLEACGQAAHAQIVHRIHNDLDERGFKGRVDTGAIVQAVRALEPVKEGTVWKQRTVVEQSASTEHQHVVEEGRKPGGPISYEGRLKIAQWVKRRLGARLREQAPGARTRISDRRVVGVQKAGLERLIEQVTFLVIRAIRRRGIPGLHPFRKTREDLAPKASGIFERAVAGLRR